MEDRYLCIEDGPRRELKVKGSRFLAQAFAATDAATAQRRLDEIRRRHHDATHHCWALRIGEPERPLERCDDDGEPSGSAGRPILGALLREKLCDALVVVTRYFGGTKLGSGGLVRAYGEAAALALAAAPRRVRQLSTALQLHCSYEDLGMVEAHLQRAAESVLAVQREFAPKPCFRVELLRSRAAAFADALREESGGRVAVREDDKPPAVG